MGLFTRTNANSQESAPIREEPTAYYRADVTPPPRSLVVSNIGVDAALSLAPVFRAVQILVTTVSAMPLQAWRGTQLVTDRPSQLIVKSAPLVEGLVFDLATTGNAFLGYDKARDRYAVIPANEVTVSDNSRMDPFAPPLITWRSLTLSGSTDSNYIVEHLKLLRRPGVVRPNGPLQAAASEVSMLLSLRDFAYQWTSLDGVPKGYLATNENLNAKESAAYADSWKKFVADNGIPVLSRGITYVPTGASPEQAQFTELLNATTTNIARLFGIPAAVLLAPLEGSTETYQNLQDGNRIFLQQTLSRYTLEIERAFTRMLPNGQTARFDESGLTRLDEGATSASTGSQAVTDGPDSPQVGQPGQ